MNKAEKYELMYSKFAWFFILMGLTNAVVSDVFARDNSNAGFGLPAIVIYFAVTSALAFMKLKFVKCPYFQKNTLYLVYRAVELFFISFSIIFVGIGAWGYILIVFTVLITGLCKGMKTGLAIVCCSFLVHSVMYTLDKLLNPYSDYQILSTSSMVLLFYYLALFMFAVLCGMIYENNLQKEVENKVLLGQLEEKYEQLAVAQEEIKIHYDKLKETNTKLEDTNKKLTSSIAEFYTLQQISQAIGSIFDIKELLKYVNDIILGVMGVNYSTIILYDEKRHKLKVHTTNIKNKDELITLNDNINCSLLLDSMNNGKQIIENFVDHDEYSFTQGREVNSMIVIPLSTKSRKFGLVLIEHKYYNAFDDENVRLLDIIGQQVGIAMENAELYQKMHELATTDSLTGVYNRLYFQERLQKEFSDAKADGYQLSLAIFDIDHFKRFNDTFGHLFGDKVLKHMAELVGRSLRNTDILARYGGEEFIILFPRTNLKEACEKVEVLRQKIAQTEIKDNLVTVSVTVSFGVCTFPEAASSENELIRYADDALYEAKNSGRNCVKMAKLL